MPKEPPLYYRVTVCHVGGIWQFGPLCASNDDWVDIYSNGGEDEAILPSKAKQCQESSTDSDIVIQEIRMRATGHIAQNSSAAK